MANGTWSFLDVTATLTGPTGIIDMGYGAATAKEGITISMAQDRDSLTVGADGEYMHSLRADKSGTAVVRCLYNSDLNSKLQAMYEAQSLSSSLWGQNSITVRNKGNQDIVVCRGVAFTRQPDKVFAEDGATVEWQFSCGKIDNLMGTY